MIQSANQCILLSQTLISDQSIYQSMHPSFVLWKAERGMHHVSYANQQSISQSMHTFVSYANQQSINHQIYLPLLSPQAPASLAWWAARCLATASSATRSTRRPGWSPRATRSRYTSRRTPGKQNGGWAFFPCHYLLARHHETVKSLARDLSSFMTFYTGMCVCFRSHSNSQFTLQYFLQLQVRIELFSMNPWPFLSTFLLE